MLFLSLSVFLTALDWRPPEPAPADAPGSEFSAGRALEVVRKIAREPHPLSTPEHARVERAILEEISRLSLQGEVEESQVQSFSVRNILVRLQGSGSVGAILLAAHYDSTPNGPGAADDGAGVAVLLETLRALQAGPRLKNDVLCLFTDGEEAQDREGGLWGARGFVTRNPGLRGAAVVFNFEARGNRGPSLMFETSAGNGWLIDQFARCVPRPFASSISYEVYRRMPNDTDFTVFRRAGLPGLNFAFIGGIAYYHTPRDTPENLDPGSLQHHGSYALSLARRFGGLPLSAMKADAASGGDQIYFDVLGWFLIHYPARWAAVLLGAVIILLLASLGFGFRRRFLSIRGVLLGFLALPSSVALSSLSVAAVWRALQAVGRFPDLDWGVPVNEFPCELALVLLAAAVGAAVIFFFLKRASTAEIALGSLAFWLIPAFLTAWYLPGGSYLFTWPLLFATGAAAALFTARSGRFRAGLVLLLNLAALPSLVLLIPTIQGFSSALTLQRSGVTAALVALSLGTLIPQLGLIRGRRPC